MSKPIVVGFDPRSADMAPVGFGLAAGRFTGARVVIVSVDTGGAYGGDLDENLLVDASEAVAALERQLEPEGPVECRRVKGTSVPRALHEVAEEFDAGLLVVGSTRRGPVGQAVPGSTAERLAHGCPCPIAVVPRDWQSRGEVDRIGVGYVDTDEGRAALRAGCALADRTGAALRVLTAVRPTFAVYAETEPHTAEQRGKEAVEVEGEFRVEAEIAARHAVAELCGGVERVEVDAFIGEPAEILADLSQHVDLLVCGSRGYGPLRAVLLGSVTHHLIAHARCPVILLPHGVEASLDALFEPQRARGFAAR